MFAVGFSWLLDFDANLIVWFVSDCSTWSLVVQGLWICVLRFGVLFCIAVCVLVRDTSAGLRFGYF